MKLAFAVGLVAAALAHAPRANAEPATHDGFYFRLGVGPGYGISWLSSTGVPSDRATGVDISTELAVGWTVRPGLVVGVGTYPMIVPSPSYRGISAGGQHVSGTGPFVDYYPDPHRGLHVQGGALFTLGYLDGTGRGTAVGAGAGATAGIGYEVFVTDEWSLGGIARVTAYELFGVGDSIAIVSPSLLVAVTRH